MRCGLASGLACGLAGLAGSPSLVPRFLRTWNQNSSFFRVGNSGVQPLLEFEKLAEKLTRI